MGTLPAEPTRQHYTFDGWNTRENGSGTPVTAGTTVTGNITVYAQWSGVTYTVTFDKNGGDNEASPQTKNVTRPDTSVGSLPTSPTRADWKFIGWNMKADGSGTAFTASTMVTGNITVYAKWTDTMVYIPGGSFDLGKEIGAAASVDIIPVSTVTLTGFYMAKYQVTQEQYYAVMETNPSYFSNSPAAGEKQGRRPVEMVSWYDAVVFCNKLSEKDGLTPAYEMPTEANTSVWSTDTASWGAAPTVNNTRWNAVRVVSGSTGYRLPTEAQWEYAAKGGATPSVGYTYAGSDDLGAVAWYLANSNNRTHEVGKLAPNALGLYDMSGNVWEWCWDWYGNYSSKVKEDPIGVSSGSTRVIRGGVWSYVSVSSVTRSGYNPYVRGSSFGFRLSLPQ